jgi:hypothetical protein
MSNPIETNAVLAKFIPEMNEILDSRINKAMICDGDERVHRALFECKQAYQNLIEKLQVVAHQIHNENKDK